MRIQRVDEVHMGVNLEHCRWVILGS